MVLMLHPQIHYWQKVPYKAGFDNFCFVLYYTSFSIHGILIMTHYKIRVREIILFSRIFSGLLRFGQETKKKMFTIMLRNVESQKPI